jgi:1,2-diacylglycerol 3-alpha-glucosyltransferase
MKNKLKIGFFTDTYLPQVNGVVTSIELFRQELENQGHEVYIFCPRVGGEDDTNRVIRFKSFRFLFQPEYHISIPFSRHILRDFWSKDLDIVHAHTPFSIGLAGYYYAYIKKVPFVHTYHTLYPEYIKSYILKGRVITPNMVAKLSAVFSNRCDLTIAPSIKIKKLLEGYGVNTPIKVLATGIDYGYYSHKVRGNNFRSQFGLKATDKVLIFVGRLGKEKNIDFLISSLPLILKKIKNAKLVIIGDGPYHATLKKQAKALKIRNSVIFTGYYKKPEVVKAYQASDLFVFASQTDTQGLVVVEAAASGLPIVAVQDDAFSEFLQNGQNGFMTKQYKMDFADKVCRILSNKALYNRMKKNSQLVAKKFTIEKQTNKLVNVYQNLIKTIT